MDSLLGCSVGCEVLRSVGLRWGFSRYSICQRYGCRYFICGRLRSKGQITTIACTMLFCIAFAAFDKWHEMNQGVMSEVNSPHQALAAAIDITLGNSSTLAYGHYRVGSEEGIWAQGPLSGATAADGSPIHSFQFRRLSSGDQEIWLVSESGSIHGCG